MSDIPSEEALMTIEPTHEGGCLCGSVRWRASGTPSRVVHCHCEMCRRSSGAAFITAAAFSTDAMQWEKGEPTWYQSSPEASRGFCARCGSWLSWRRGDEMWLTVGTFDQPEAVPPAGTSHGRVTTVVGEPTRRRSCPGIPGSSEHDRATEHPVHPDRRPGLLGHGMRRQRGDPYSKPRPAGG